MVSSSGSPGPAPTSVQVPRWVAGDSALGGLALPAMGVRVVNLRRGDGHPSAAAAEALLAAGDTLVLSGHPAALALAEDKLLRG